MLFQLFVGIALVMISIGFFIIGKYMFKKNP